VLGGRPAGGVLLPAGGDLYVSCLSLGLIFSATSATAAEAVQKTVLFSIPLVQLSGFAFPIRNMPELLQWATELIPATHFIRVTRAIYLRGVHSSCGANCSSSAVRRQLIALAVRTLDGRLSMGSCGTSRRTCCGSHREGSVIRHDKAFVGRRINRS
jgi:hypothetical protein